MPFNKDAMKAVGFNDSEISAAADMIRTRMIENGNTEDEIKSFFNIQDVPPIEPIAEHFAQQARRGNPVKGEEPQDLQSWSHVFKQGPKNSIWGTALGVKQEGLSEDAGMAKQVVSGAETMLMDLPVIAGATAVAAPFVGPLAPVVGLGITEAGRSLLMQLYKKGINSPADVMDLAEATAHGLLKGLTLGKAGEIGAKFGAEKISKLAASFGAESIGGFFGGAVGGATAMTAAGGAYEGHVPTAEEFASNAILGTAFHTYSTVKQFQASIEASSSSTAGYKQAMLDDLQSRIEQKKAKLEKIYVKTGISPTDLETMSVKDPVLGQQLSSENTNVPDALSDKIQASVKSDFVYENGKLHRGDSPEALEYLKPKKVSVEELEQEISFTDSDIETAARLHDPEAFQKLSEQESRNEAATKMIEQLNQEIEANREAVDRANRLEEVKRILEAHAYKNQEEFYALSEEEKLLRPTEAKDLKAREQSEIAASKMDEVERAVMENKLDIGLITRVENAMKLGEKTVRDTKKDLVRNRHVDLFDINDPMQKPLPGMDTEFTEESQLSPKTNESYQMHLIEQLDSEPIMDGQRIKYQLAKSFKTSFSGETGAEGSGNLEVLPRVRPKVDWASIDTYKNFLKNIIKADLNKDLDLYIKQHKLDKVKKLKFSERMYDAVIRASDTSRIAETFLMDEVFDPKTGAKMSEGFDKIIKRVPKEKIDDFRKFVLYRQGLDISQKGGYVSDTFNDKIAKKFIEDHPDFAPIHDDIVKWSNALLQYEVKAGTLSMEEYARAEKEHPFYAPTKRINEDTTAKSAKAKRALQQRRGSDLPFLDPITAWADKAVNTARRVAENEAVLTAVAADKASGGEILHFSRNANPGEKLAPNEIGYYENGQYKIAAFKDNVLAESFYFSDRQLFKLHPLLKAVLKVPRTASSILRGGISIGADFVTAHNERNILNAYIIGGEKSFVDHIKALRPSRLIETARGESPLYKEAQKSGAFLGVLKNVEDMAAKYEYSLQSDKSLLSRGTNVAKNIWTIGHEVMKVVSEAQKLEAFERAKKEGRANTFEEARAASQEVSRGQTSGLNKGVFSEVLNAFIPFLHYENNGLLRYGESWYEDPKHQVKRTAMMASVSALAWYLTKDDEYYKNNVPEYEKYAYWHVGYNGQYIKIAKPWTAGRLAAAVGSGVLDTLYNRNPESVAKAFEAVFESIPKPTPGKVALNSFYKMLVENTDTLTNRAIIPEYQMKLYPTLQRNSFTTATGIKIAELLDGIANGLDNFMHTDTASKLVNAVHLNSPIMVDKMIQVFSGKNGASLVRAVESTAKKMNILNEESGQSMTPEEFFSQPFWKVAPDLPIIGALIHREAIYSAQVIRDFDEKYKELKEAHIQYTNAEEMIGDPENYDKAAKVMNLLEEKHPELKMWDRIQEAKASMMTQQKLSFEILADRNMRKVERVQHAEDVYKANVVTAKSILEEMKDFAHTQN